MVRMRVIPVEAGAVLHFEAVDRVVAVAHRVHAAAVVALVYMQAVPVDGGVFAQAVGKGHVDELALLHPQHRAERRAGVDPGSIGPHVAAAPGKHRAARDAGRQMQRAVQPDQGHPRVAAGQDQRRIEAHLRPRVRRDAHCRQESGGLAQKTPAMINI
jgi:hypothetical protein